MTADRKEKPGYLPAGRYKLSEGSYLLKVRVGDRVKEIRGRSIVSGVHFGDIPSYIAPL